MNFEDTEKDGSQIIEGGRVTPSLIKVGGITMRCQYEILLLSTRRFNYQPKIAFLTIALLLPLNVT